MGWPSVSLPSISLPSVNYLSDVKDALSTRYNMPGMDNPYVAMTMGLSPYTRNMYNNYIMSKNYEQQRELMEYQKQMQMLQFQREDNSIARRVRDLKAAGLSPVLAAGQGASSGANVPVSAPQMGKLDEIGVMEIMKMKEDISRTRIEQAYIAQQAAASAISGSKMLGEIELNERMKKKVDAETNYKNSETSEKLYNLALAMKYGVTTNPGEIGRNYRDLSQALIDSVRKFGSVFQKGNEQIDRAGKVIKKNVPKNSDYIREFKNMLPFWAQ